MTGTYRVYELHPQPFPMLTIRQHSSRSSPQRTAEETVSNVSNAAQDRKQSTKNEDGDALITSNYIVRAAINKPAKPIHTIGGTLAVGGRNATTHDYRETNEKRVCHSCI